VEQGGGASEYGSANVIVGSAVKKAQAEISHSEITASRADGVLLSKGSKLNYFNYNKVNTNTAYPLTMYAEDVFAVATNNQFVNNGKNEINVINSGNGFGKQPADFIEKTAHY
jgi:hypothetical protein